MQFQLVMDIVAFCGRYNLVLLCFPTTQGQLSAVLRAALDIPSSHHASTQGEASQEGTKAANGKHLLRSAEELADLVSDQRQHNWYFLRT
jgi:hypothetical protein